MPQPHANVECKWRKRVGGRGEGSLDSALGTKQINKGPFSRQCRAGSHRTRPFFPRPNPYSATLGLSVMAWKCFIRLTSVNYRHQSAPTTCNNQQNVTVEVGLIRRPAGGRLSAGEKIAESPSPPPLSAKGVIHPSVRPLPSGPRTRPSFLPSP